MKKFKKGLLPVLALGAAMVMVVSCGPTGGAGYQEWNPEMSPRELKAEITWWNNYQQPTSEDDPDSNDFAEYRFIQGVIEDFNKIYPNVKVNTVGYDGGYNAIQAAVNSGLSGGNLPNMATCYGDHVANYHNAGATLAMDGFLTDETIGFGKSVDETGKVIEDASTAYNDFNQSYLNGEKSMYASNEFLSLPYSKSAETLAVNQDVFDKVGAGACGTTQTEGYTAPVAAETKQKYEIPSNWEELIATARQMKVDFPQTFETQKNGDGLFSAVPFVYDSAQNMFISFLTMSGIEYTDASGKDLAHQILFNTEETKDILIQLKKWNNEGLICSQNQLEWSNQALGYHQYSSTLLAQGKVFMCISSTAGARYFSADGFKASLNPTPTFTLDALDGDNDPVDETQHRVIAQGPSITFFDKADINENYASWLFYKFLTNTDNAAQLAYDTAYFPVRASSYETEDIETLLTAAENKDQLTSESTREVKNNTYAGTALELDAQYTEDNDYIVTDVFDRSSAARTAVGNLVDAVFNNATADTDDEIEALVEEELTKAYNSAIA